MSRHKNRLRESEFSTLSESARLHFFGGASDVVSPSADEALSDVEGWDQPSIRSDIADIKLWLSQLNGNFGDLHERLSHGAAFATFVSSLGIEGYEVKKPIPVTIRPDGNEFVASFFDANVSTGGDTPQEAIGNLQELIADFFDHLENVSYPELGRSMQRQKRVLKEFVCRTS